ncbi:protein DBF4 homolog A [Cheilinus undulatus]|uniref:protein DBF4 homolog A n=1 Tax=Cheilinus undulatus TaxID=241271 RepID=UPI001BD4CE53|nr:protein DBF4 homolog A [Cheilinus undulatus]
MKPKRTQRHPGSQIQGKGLGAGGDKATLSQAKPAQVKPFAGKVFYLDLPSNRGAETLERDIKELGGTVEKFFSKEIKYLVSNKREARFVHYLKQDSPVPSPDSGPSSPHPCSNPHRPGSHGDIIKSKSQGQTDTIVTSRGKSLVEKVVKEQKKVQMNKILSNALEWGVKILYVDDILMYVEKKKKTVSSQCPATTAVKKSTKVESAEKHSFQKIKGGRISKPFIKVEDSSRHYRPIYLTMPNMPEFNLNTLPPCTPFRVEDKDPAGNKQRGQSEERAHGRKKNRDKKRGGYCECCLIKYENLTSHLQSDRHKAFSKSEEYLVVDRLVSALPCSLIHMKPQVKRPKCSVSSVLVTPGPCGKTEQRHKRDLNTSEILKEEQQQTDDGHKGSNSGQSLKMKNVSASAPLIHKEKDRRSNYTHLDRSKHKPSSHKRPCRQNSLTFCTQTAGLDEIPQPDTETAPSRGETVASTLSGFTQVDPADEIITQEMNSSPSHSCSVNKQKEASHQHEESDRRQDSSLYEAAQNKVTGNNSEKDETSPSSLNFSPVRKIQRRVRVYKRKRRKVDAQVECVKPSEIPTDPLMKLWEIFQSSDDMEVEFLGF